MSPDCRNTGESAQSADSFRKTGTSLLAMVTTSGPVLWAAQAGARGWTSSSQRGVAYGFHASMPGYAATRLVELPELAPELGVGAVFVKEESDRFGLRAFKILGASWAVNQALCRHAGFDAPAADLAELQDRAAANPVTLVTATDGNHGRGLARMAAILGLPARVYLPAGTPAAVVSAISGEGAQVLETDLIYDDVVQAAADSITDRPDELLIQDTAWPGYEEIPAWIVQGYHTLFEEIDLQLGDRRPDLVAVPTGVGSLLQAALKHYRAPSLTRRPAVMAVEPVSAACVTASLAADERVSVDTSIPTIMAGLNCGSVSTIAWPAIRHGLDAGVGVTDDQAREAMERLGQLGVNAGPCGAASLAGVRIALADADRRAALGVTGDSVVVLLSTEAR
jgi:diaminopropionate ammonia-lyase